MSIPQSSLSESWLTRHLSAHNWNMLPVCGVRLLGNVDKIEMTQRRAARWVKSNTSSYDSVTEMLHDLGWRSLEQRRLDARLIMFYKIVYGLVAIQLPSYIEHPMKITRHMHSLYYRQIHTAANYSQFSFFPVSIVLWNRLSEDIVLLSDLDSFKQAVTKITHSFP